ncbi:hypothetical protein [Microbacterium indicum]|uniref:hypothetical protein n=1 Tax=Microbacterium indicum TaxID=358100 RepID=UPI0004276DF4|nr:hypothetical protein [Microbacterium indicum]
MDIDLLGMLNSLWQVVVVGLLFGAGLPALFALGMRSLATVPAGHVVNGDEPVPTTTAGRIGAIVCFGLCGLVALFGVVVIVFGKQIFG